MYIHIFAFYIQAGQEKLKYKIGAKCSIGENTYRDLMLGSVMRNMGINYKTENYQNFLKIKYALYDSYHWKVGRFVTRNENITDEEIVNVLQYLGYNLASIYLNADEVKFFNGLTDEV